jgi:hypothetical protein
MLFKRTARGWEGGIVPAKFNNAASFEIALLQC